jgi:hypothetical protein
MDNTDPDDDDDGDDDVQEEKLLLYDSWKRQVCGCRISVRRFAALLLESQRRQLQNASSSNILCPKCQHVVKFVVDEVGSMSQKDHDDSTSTIVFKYGKQVYQLTVARTSSLQQQQQQQQPSQLQLDASFWTTSLNLLSCTGMTTTTAQGRIAHALRLNVHTMKASDLLGNIIVRFCSSHTWLFSFIRSHNSLFLFFVTPSRFMCAICRFSTRARFSIPAATTTFLRKRFLVNCWKFPTRAIERRCPCSSWERCKAWS